MSLIRIGHDVMSRLIENGYEAYFVGGMVRDRLLKRDIYDVDITTSAKPEQVIELFDKTIPTGIKHGTVTVMIEGIPVEVTTFRVEEDYQDFRRPSEVSFTTSLVEDLKRRDFTMNAIAQSIEGHLIDPFNGLEDLKRHRIKAVGVAKERFTEDPLRMLRGIRFVSKLGFEFENDTYEALCETSSLIEHISKERVKKEIDGIISSKSSSQAFDLFLRSGLCDWIESFKELKQYEALQLASLNDSIELFALIGLTVDSLEDYLRAWPFSNVEKRSIKAIRECYEQKIPPQYIQFKYKGKIALHYHRIQCLLQKKEEPFKLYPLCIEDRKELAIKVDEILALVLRPKGPWMSQLLENLLFEVVMGTLENQKENLRDYILNQELGEHNEIKK